MYRNLGKAFLIHTVLIVIMTGVSPILAQKTKHDSRCDIIFMIKGLDNEGKFSRHVFDAHRFPERIEFTQEAKQKQIRSEKNYDRTDYELIHEPSRLQDCAGYVLSKLWGVGKHRMGGKGFYDNIIKRYGKKISGPSSDWAGVKMDDVVYYDGGHVAIVTDVSRNSDGTNTVTIETKDNQQSVYMHRLGNPPQSDDPTVGSYGMPSIYRVDASNISIEEVENSCDDQDDQEWLEEEERIVEGLEEELTRRGIGWVLKDGFPKRNPKGKEFSSHTKTKTIEISYDEKSVSIHRQSRHGNTGEIRHDWQFDFTIEGDIPRKLLIGDEFHLTITGKASANKDRDHIFAGVGISCEGFKRIYHPPNEKRKNRAKVGRWDKKIHESDTKAFTFRLEEGAEKLWLNIFVGGKGTTYRYEWEME